MTARALLLDIGGVVIRTPFELMDDTVSGGGRLPRGDDPRWAQVLAGELSEREYWRLRAHEAGASDARALIAPLFERPEEDVVRSQVRQLMRDCTRRGLRVGLLTNDLVAFHGAQWAQRMRVFGEADVLVDGSCTGVLKPRPEAFAMALEALDVPAAATVFVDDQPVNVDGARAAGLQALLFDVAAPDASVAAVRATLE